MNELVFRKAERKKAKARIALCAPSGGGKTHSALLIAKGMGGSIAVIDTENGSAQMEAGKKGIPDFDVLTLEAPFEVSKYIEAIHAAEEAGYDVIIIDSLSHAWAGSGGLLERQGKISKVTKNSYTAWGEVTPIHNLLIETMLQCKSHLIVTMRSKVEIVLEENERGKMVPVKKGMAPIQREGMDYEFTICFDLEIGSHLATAPKDRTSLFGMNPFVPSEKTGKELMEWLNGGASEHPGEDQTATFKEQLITLGMTQEKWEEAVKKSWSDMTIKEAGEWIKRNAFAIEERKKRAEEAAKVEEKEVKKFDPEATLKKLEEEKNKGKRKMTASEKKFDDELNESLEKEKVK
jgi:hypothetical protein